MPVSALTAPRRALREIAGFADECRGACARPGHLITACPERTRHLDPGAVLELTEDQWDEMIGVNRAVPELQPRGHGDRVTIPVHAGHLILAGINPAPVR